MPRIIAVGTAVPPYVITQEEARRAAAEVFGRAFPDLDRRLDVFVNAGIERRHFSRPLEWYLTPHDFGERNRAYVETAVELGALACRRCLAAAGASPADVDALLFVSTTGLATPSIDARLMDHLGLRRDIERTPVWGLGCAGGAAGLARAAHVARARPRSLVLVLAVELCSLTFQWEERTKSNFVATALFADGAAAVLVAGDDVVAGDRPAAGQPGGPAPAVLASHSYTWPDTLDVMGWEVSPRGLHVVFSRSIPSIVRRHVWVQTAAFLERERVPLSAVSRFIVHPGGPKVLDAYRESFGLEEQHLLAAREVLREYGNMSSPTVLFVLERALREPPPPGAVGLVAALGPGFTSEQVILQW
ncbi:MAG: type III polyketide synthase [Firmicutes bacterium]|nr:type III polyketide synthase [Bacillota bacterium]